MNNEFREIENLKKKFNDRLTAEQEIELLNEYRQLKTFICNLITTNYNTKLNKKNTIALVWCYKRKKQISDIFINCNMRLVISIAKRFANRGLPVMDLIHEGIDGITHSLEKHDSTKSRKFSTYSTIWIEQRIRRAIENKSRLVRIPNNKLLIISKIKGVYRRLKLKYDGEAPTPEEIAEGLARLDPPVILSSKEVEEYGRLDQEFVSLDENVGEDENIAIVNYITYDSKYQPEEKIETNADKDYLNSLLNQLIIEDKKFMQLKYGFLDGYEKTPKQMSIILKKPLKEVNIIENRILDQLRNLIDKKKINCL